MAVIVVASSSFVVSLFSAVRAAFRHALATRAEVSALMAESYRRAS